MATEITDSFTPNSSNIEKVWYNRITFRLTIQFKGGRKYIYDSVLEDTYLDLKAAESVGKFVNQNIVGVYPSEKIA